MPNPKGKIELAKEFRKLAEKNDMPMSPTYFEGFFYMSLFAHVLEQIEGTITKGKIINVFENMKNVDFKGIKLNFDPKTREILQTVWIYTGPDKPWVKKAV